MKKLMKVIGLITKNNPNHHCFSPLFMHYVCEEDSCFGTDYSFWREYCEDTLPRCDKMVVVQFEGWDTSIGVDAEIALAKSLNIPIEFVYYLEDKGILV